MLSLDAEKMIELDIGEHAIALMRSVCWRNGAQIGRNVPSIADMDPSDNDATHIPVGHSVAKGLNR